MSEHTTSSREVLSPEQVAERQVAVAEAWARIYADPNLELDRSAEIVLRNPVFYLRDVHPATLPKALQSRWFDLINSADSVSQSAAVEAVEWGHGVQGLEKLQHQVFTGNIDPNFRGPVSDVMRNAATLFAESVQHSPGNTNYYAGNVKGAEGWLRNAQARAAS